MAQGLTRCDFATITYTGYGNDLSKFSARSLNHEKSNSPSAVVCGCRYTNLDRRYCYLADTTLIERLRGYRYRPEWSILLPSDIDYITPVPNSSQVSFCLPKSFYEGKSATKLLAIQSFQTQIGLIVETGTMPDDLRGLVDCFGYLTAFVKSNEIFVYVNNLNDGT